VTTGTFFVNSVYFGEVLSPELIELPPARLFAELLAGALVYGLARIEQAIYATYPHASAEQIIAGINLALARWQEAKGRSLPGVQ
jgi:hypothetical protein